MSNWEITRWHKLEIKMKTSTNKNKKSAANPFGDVKGEQFGGQANYLQMNEGEVIHGFAFVKIEKNVELAKGNKPVDIAVAVHPETKEEMRMPAAAVFTKNIEAAKLKAGSVFSVARLKDSIKKSNPGKGKPMAVYSLLVTKRK